VGSVDVARRGTTFPIPHQRPGFTLLEVVVASAILAIGTVAVLEAITRSLQAGQMSHEHTRAVMLAEGKMAELRSLPQLDSGALEGAFAGEIAAPPSSPDYRWRAEVQDTGEDAPALVRVTVYWESGRHTREVSIDSLLQKSSSDPQSSPPQ